MSKVAEIVHFVTASLKLDSNPKSQKYHSNFCFLSREGRGHIGVCNKQSNHSLTCIVHSADDSEPGTTEAQSRSTSISIPIAEGSTERNRMHRGRHFELQELETDKNIGCGGEMDLLDPSSVGVRTLEGERRCRLHTRQNLSSAVDDKSSTSMIRKDKMQSQKEMDEIGTGDLTAWFREEFEKANAQMTMEKDEWAISRVNGTA